MEFCTECGSRLVPKKVNSGKQALVMLVCTKCEFKKQELNNKVMVNSRIIEHNPKQFVAVIGKEEQNSAFCQLYESTAPDVRITQLMFGKYKPEDQTNLQLNFSDASGAATHSEKTPKQPFPFYQENLIKSIEIVCYFWFSSGFVSCIL